MQRIHQVPLLTNLTFFPQSNQSNRCCRWLANLTKQLVPFQLATFRETLACSSSFSTSLFSLFMRSNESESTTGSLSTWPELPYLRSFLLRYNSLPSVSQPSEGGEVAKRPLHLKDRKDRCFFVSDSRLSVKDLILLKRCDTEFEWILHALLAFKLQRYLLYILTVGTSKTAQLPWISQAGYIDWLLYLTSASPRLEGIC